VDRKTIESAIGSGRSREWRTKDLAGLVTEQPGTIPLFVDATSASQKRENPKRETTEARRRRRRAIGTVVDFMGVVFVAATGVFELVVSNAPEILWLPCCAGKVGGVCCLISCS
jgi:hypothetical protein